jgi:GNAT superfamily N-acetyltransferase
MAGQVAIIILDDVPVGWVQTVIEDDVLFIAQRYVDRPFQRQGIGFAILTRLLADAIGAKRSVRLNVVKISPASRLYERLGFHAIGEDERKFYMQSDAMPTNSR